MTDFVCFVVVVGFLLLLFVFVLLLLFFLVPQPLSFNNTIPRSCDSNLNVIGAIHVCELATHYFPASVCISLYCSCCAVVVSNLHLLVSFGSSVRGAIVRQTIILFQC